jgi:hypothetical protein
MPLTSGTKLGPYEIQSPLGAGGMGEVYRGRDVRLGREVAIKVLPEAFARDGDRLQRFEHEARLLSTVNHPNILAIHDVGQQGDLHYLVSELLEGQTLREKMAAGPLSQRRVTEYAIEMARGLAAAHEKGVVHRDLKPDNIFITKDNRVKILDFGLAKQSSLEHSESAATMSGPSPTQPGTVMGTVGYMSPEQVRGQNVDHRSDIFSFGAILYEMLSGKRAFKGESSVETMNAILKEDPPELSESGLNVMPGPERVVRHCLEKEPGLRFQSARDLTFDLESLSSLTGTSKTVAAQASRAHQRNLLLIGGVAALVVAVAAAFWAGHSTQKATEPLFTRLTFRGGHVSSARFSPDGHTVVYSAAFGDEPLQVYTTRPDAPQSRELGLKNSSILAVSKQDELAITLNHVYVQANASGGTLARLPLTGGSPRELNENVGSADWSPDGQSLALVTLAADGSVNLEYPPGTRLYQTQGWGRRTAGLARRQSGGVRGQSDSLGQPGANHGGGPPGQEPRAHRPVFRPARPGLGPFRQRDLVYRLDGPPVGQLVCGGSERASAPGLGERGRDRSAGHFIRRPRAVHSRKPAARYCRPFPRT